MAVAMFAGIPVADFTAAVAWYETFLGGPPTFAAHDTEVVWEIAGERSVYVVQDPARAGHGLLTLFVDDLDARVGRIAARGIEPTERETYDNGVRKVIYHDPEGNEFGLGGGPAG